MSSHSLKGILRVGDEVSYHSIKDICNQCFGEQYEGYQRGTYMICDGYIAWFPKMAYEEEGILKAGSKTKEWVNILSPDGQYITEYNVHEPRNEESELLQVHRLVFGQNKGEEYKFLGVFKTASCYDKDVTYAKRTYKRLDTEVDLSSLGKVQYEKEEEKYIQKLFDIDHLTETEKNALVKTRIGQSNFRAKLLYIHNQKCMLCSLAYTELLIASHIKEWSVCNSEERLDEENGLLLCALHDSVFDKHLISFDENGKIMISSKLNSESRILLNLNEKKTILMSDKMKEYRKYHREKLV